MIVKDVYINAPARLVYAFLTEPAKIAQLIGTEADVNPHPGGLFRIVATATDIIRGTYLEAVPDSKVTFTWGFEGEGHTLPAGSTVVEISLHPQGAGTRLNLVHRELPAAWRADHVAGWGLLSGAPQPGRRRRPASSVQPTASTVQGPL